jgi:hypothetical protein
VVVIDVEITFGLDADVEHAMKCRLLEHVVKEADSSGDVSPRSSVEIDHNFNSSFFCLSGDFGESNSWGFLTHGLMVLPRFKFMLVQIDARGMDVHEK